MTHGVLFGPWAAVDSSEGWGTEPEVQPPELAGAKAARPRSTTRRLDLCPPGLAMSSSGRAHREHLASKGTAHSTPETTTLVGQFGFGNVNCDRCW